MSTFSIAPSNWFTLSPEHASPAPFSYASGTTDLDVFGEEGLPENAELVEGWPVGVASLEWLAVLLFALPCDCFDDLSPLKI